MRLILNGVLSFGLLFCLTIALARQIGLSQPPSERLRDLRFTECSPPCWIGIVPGQTIYSEAVVQIKLTFAIPDEVLPVNPNAFQLYTLIPVPNFNTPRYHQTIAIEREVGFSETVVTDIRWMFQPSLNTGDVPSLTLGDVVSAIGTPTCVYLGMPSQGWTLIWDKPEGVMQVNAQVSDRLSWWQPISILAFRKHTIGFGQDSCHANAADHYAWRGLLHREHYQRRGI